ncbi:E3 ubiquitin-protein ligase ATL6 [Camellia lanceoleosa]|uniref:E3 ubiquitin-protein ligase ATL6 n=1 Tax=Camellia lanceoleosa TaxID=1840588 RepID=A0ACC0FAH8_9ERIC|nr:E3 ubiquitin-protein ligase ATL6 [Camellia lanceoleosa]
MSSQVIFQPLHNFHSTDFNYSLQSHNLGLLLVVIVFAVILLITCLYFYYHFVCRYGHLSLPITTTTNNNDDFSSAPPAHVPAELLGLDSTSIDKLPTFVHRSMPSSNKEEETECSICLGLFEDEEIIKVLPKCQHAYHTHCVDKWLRTRSSCPLCRATLQVVQSPNEFCSDSIAE